MQATVLEQKALNVNNIDVVLIEEVKNRLILDNDEDEYNSELFFLDMKKVQNIFENKNDYHSLSFSLLSKIYKAIENEEQDNLFSRDVLEYSDEGYSFSNSSGAEEQGFSNLYNLLKKDDVNNMKDLCGKSFVKYTVEMN